MIFKTLFSVSVLALFSVVSAVPPNIDDEYVQLQQNCYLYNGKLISSSDRGKYACIQRYFNEREAVANSKDSVCFNANNIPYCINSKFTNIQECNVYSNRYNYDKCMQNFVKGPIRLYLRLRDFETNEKFISTPILDYEECIHNSGIYLIDKKGNYVCLSSEPVSFPDEEHCVNVQETSEESEKVQYCIQQENTNYEYCNKTSDFYDYDECMDKLNSLSIGRIAKITEY